MKKTAFIVMALTILSKFLGFFREIVLAYYYGSSNVSDAYLISWTIPGVIFAFAGAGITTCFIPLYTKILTTKGSSASKTFMNKLITFMILLNLILGVIIYILAPYIFRYVTPGFNTETMKLAVKFTRISVIGIFLYTIIDLLIGFIQVNKNFILPALIGIPFNLVLIFSIIFSSKISINLLAYGIVFSKIAELIFILPYLRKYNFKFRFDIRLKDSYLKELFILAIPMMISISVNEINVLIDRSLSSNIMEGGISALNYSSKLNSFIFGVFAISITTIIYPTISKMTSENNILAFKKIILKSILLISVFIIPSTFGIIIFSKQIVSLVFARGKFEYSSIINTSIPLIFYSIGLLSNGIKEIFNKSFYALHDTKTPVINSILAIIINIILNFILSEYMGIAGLALATSISSILCSILLYFNLKRKVGSIIDNAFVFKLIKITLSSFTMIIVSLLIFKLLNLFVFSEKISFLITVGIAASVYFIFLRIIKLQEVVEIYDIILNKIKLILYRKKNN